MEGGRETTLIEFNDKLDIGVVLINPKNSAFNEKKFFNNFNLKKPIRRKKTILNVKTINDFQSILKFGNDLIESVTKIVPRNFKYFKFI